LVGGKNRDAKSYNPHIMKTRLAKLLDRLENFYGKPKRSYPVDPYEMVLHRNCGYPQSDDRCEKGFLALKQKVGLRPAEILATLDTKLAEVMRAGGMVPELRARRLKEIAARVESEFGGDLQAVLRRPLSEAKKVFKKFPTIGDPGAEKILLFTKTAPVAAVPSNCVHVLPRLGFGQEKENYSATYRSAQEALRSELPEDCAAQLRAYLLIKRHGQELCKASRPKCEQCPVSPDCNYFQSQRPSE
jgi:endonuclease-3